MCVCAVCVCVCVCAHQLFCLQPGRCRCCSRLSFWIAWWFVITILLPAYMRPPGPLHAATKINHKLPQTTKIYQERLSDLIGLLWGTYGIVYKVLRPLLVDKRSMHSHCH